MNNDKLKLYAHFYHNMGMNITRMDGDCNIENSFKQPVDENWETYYNVRQDIDYINNQNWNNASGLGVILGYNEYRAIDIDELFNRYGCYECFPDRETAVTAFLRNSLEILGLPSDYEWVVDSGSGYGMHIIFKTDQIEGYDPNVLFFTHKENSYYHKENLHYVCNPPSVGDKNIDYHFFSRLELRWKDHLVLPPSAHVSGLNYDFRNKRLPTNRPSYISVDTLNNFIDFYCGDVSVFKYKNGDVSFSILRSVKRTAKYDSWRSKFHRNEDYQDMHVLWLQKCHSSRAINGIAIKYLLGDGVVCNKDRVKEYMVKADDYIAHFNLASLKAVGYLEGSKSEILEHLKHCSMPELQNEVALIREKIESLEDKEPKKNIEYIIFDTETTGIPLKYDVPSSDVNNWPRLVQLSWITADCKGNIISKHNHIIKPTNFRIPFESTKLHGITNEVAIKEGSEIFLVLKLFMHDLNYAKCIVAHNANFDKKVLGAELIRAGQQDTIQLKETYCTMVNGIDICKIPGYKGYRYPKLSELYKKLFGTVFLGAHNAENDVLATYECFFKMIK